MNKLYLPEKLKVGFQKRGDTYTKKLAYVIYYDHKGVLRKENSWESWRDKGIKPQEFDNKPISGFVLNRPVGGVKESYGWNVRNSYIRVYDPRGFEIEITLENLLFILEVCDSIKGKGLEGEFVYGWDGTDLVLVPTNTEDYIKSIENTKLANSSIKFKDLIIGKTYQFKDGGIGVYLGLEQIKNLNEYKGEWRTGIIKNPKSYFGGWTYDTNCDFFDNKHYAVSFSKEHIFYMESGDKNKFRTITTNKTLSGLYNDSESDYLGEYYDEFYESNLSVLFDSIEEKKQFPFFKERFKKIHAYVQNIVNEDVRLNFNEFFYEKINDNNYYLCELTYKMTNNMAKRNDYGYRGADELKIVRNQHITFKEGENLIIRNVRKNEQLERDMQYNEILNELNSNYCTVVFSKGNKKYLV